MNKILSNKWRPMLLDDIIGQDDSISIVRNVLRNKYIHHSIIISGSHGIGKTTLARIFVKCLNCEVGITEIPCNKCYCCVSIDNFNNPDSIEIDAASKTRVEDIKDMLMTSAYKTFKNRFKTYIIDECHMLSINSFNYLLKILEEEANNNIYVFVTTNLKKIPNTVKSRCLNLELKKIDIRVVKERIKKILIEERYSFSDYFLEKILNFSDGSLRSALNIIEKFGSKKNVEIDYLDDILGLMPEESILLVIKNIIEKNFYRMFDEVIIVLKKTINIDNVIMQVQFLLYKMILYKFSVIYDKNICCSYLFKYLVSNISIYQLRVLYNCLLKSKALISLSPNKEVGIHLLFVNMFVKINGKAEIL
jgi:DNA polymerase-3 subunit gamma/tau